MNIPINFTQKDIDCGYIGEHNAVRLEVTIPADMLDATHLYRLAFEIGDLSARSAALTATDGIVEYDVPLSVASTRVVNMQLEEYASDESFIKKSALVILRFADSVPNGTVGIDNDAGMVAEVTANTAARHTHDNKAVLDGITAEDLTAYDGAVADSHSHANKDVLDKFSEVDGALKYDGEAIGGSAGIDYTLIAFIAREFKSATAAIYVSTPTAVSDSESGACDGTLSTIISNVNDQCILIPKASGNVLYTDNFGGTGHTEAVTDGEIVLFVSDESAIVTVTHYTVSQVLETGLIYIEA